MLTGIVILLNQKVYFVNVYARISLNRLFSDTIYQLMWDTKKSENILMCVRCPSAPPWSRPRYQYVQRSDAEGRLHVLLGANREGNLLPHQTTAPDQKEAKVLLASLENM